RDSREATIAAIDRALECDYVISSGGVSVGAYDFVKDALEAFGGETKFWRVAMKPGKPVFLSRVRERLFFGLPGNPVSCMVTFTLFVAPALRRAMGMSGVLPPVVNLKTTAPLRGSERRTYVRVAVYPRDGDLVAEPMLVQGSGATTSMRGANGLAVVQEGVREIEAGASVPVVLMGLMGPMGPIGGTAAPYRSHRSHRSYCPILAFFTLSSASSRVSRFASSSPC